MQIKKYRLIIMSSNNKRTFPFMAKAEGNQTLKKIKSYSTESKYDHSKAINAEIFNFKNKSSKQELPNTCISKDSYIPLAEKMRPKDLNSYIGQAHLIGPKTLLHDLLKNGEIPSMILWGPPGCGKTSLVNVIIQESKSFSNKQVKFIKLSATTASINDVRKAVSEAESQSKLGRSTIVFMDEIHRFNKLQQDIFLPHVEAGTFILIGATTENPSSGLNSALLSRCRVFILKKLNKDDLLSILTKAITTMGGEIVTDKNSNKILHAKFLIEENIIDWLAEVCDGDARVALGALEITVQSQNLCTDTNKKPKRLELEDIKNSLKETQMLTDSKSNSIYHMHCALHHCIIGDDDNAALYWLARIMEAGEDPVYTARKLVKIASEEIDFSDEHVLDTAVHTMHACQMIGMPECDVLLAQCVIYMARAEKSNDILKALRACQSTVENHKGPQPKVPLFIKDRSGQGKLKATLGTNFKNLVRQENLKKSYLPEGLENVNFFADVSKFLLNSHC